MSTKARNLLVARATVRQGGKVIANLRYAGRQVTVVRADGKAVGRLFPAGYPLGLPDGTDLVDAWTAKHPSVPTPSDQLLGERLTVEAAVELLLFPAC